METEIKWKTCSVCGKDDSLFVFKIECWTQYCSPEKQGQRYVCDDCLEKARIDPNKLAKLFETIKGGN